jgi:hypothetical protein
MARYVITEGACDRVPVTLYHESRTSSNEGHSKVGNGVWKQRLAVNRSISRSATPGVGHERVLWRNPNTKNNEHDNVDSIHLRFSVLTTVLLRK